MPLYHYEVDNVSFLSDGMVNIVSKQNNDPPIKVTRAGQLADILELFDFDDALKYYARGELYVKLCKKHKLKMERLKTPYDWMFEPKDQAEHPKEFNSFFKKICTVKQKDWFKGYDFDN